IYVGYLKRKLLGGVLAGLTFIIPGAVVMIILSWLYVAYGSLPQVNNFLYVLKPAVFGIIAAGIIKLGRAAIRNWFLAVLLVGSFVGMRFRGHQFSADPAARWSLESACRWLANSAKKDRDAIRVYSWVGINCSFR